MSRATDFKTGRPHDIGLRRHGCSHRLLPVQGTTANAARTIRVRYGSNNLEFDQFRVASAHFAQQPSGTTDRRDCVTSLPWPAPFSLKLNQAHVVRDMVAAFDPSALLQAHGAASLPRPNVKRTEPPRSARHQLPRHMCSDHRFAHARQSGTETVRADALRGHACALQQQVEFVGKHLRVAKPRASTQMCETIDQIEKRLQQNRPLKVVTVRYGRDEDRNAAQDRHFAAHPEDRDADVVSSKLYDEEMAEESDA
jgi:hypothetical protein